MPKGGARVGAGRKPSTLKGVVKRLPGDTAAAILAEIRANEKWIKLASSKDERIQLDTLKYLTDRAYGKAAQAMDLNLVDKRPILLDHSIPRPERPTIQ